MVAKNEKMIEINCHIKVIVYAENRELPQLLVKGSEDYGILPKSVLIPLRTLNGRTFKFKLRENATVNTLIGLVKREMVSLSPYYRYWSWIRWAVSCEERYYLDDYSQKVPFLMRKYFGYPDNREVDIELLISTDAGEVDNADGLEYYVYSRERGKHHIPHVHVITTDHEYSAVISIIDGEMIEGRMPKRKLKKAKRRILDNQSYFVQCWNTKTDGLRIDINKHFHLIEY